MNLQRSGVELHEIDDLIQDAYCKFAALESVDHIDRPPAFFMQIVKNLRRDRLRRDKIVNFEEFTENGEPTVNDWEPSIEKAVSARQELGLVEAVLETLPRRCRDIFTLKRIEGLSQREIARRLEVTENIVENDVQKAVKALQNKLRATEATELKEALVEADRKQTG
ncbi:RNA polymerase sigma factor [Qipengyuania qiaonensis]|uniref:Sigma-70 family RNA polymerase sigma factor n=1 Tax=Qipengyuania qiaonensis TaxID=2867240 RepID=A0ABS7JAZ6_9SPHN|nr:sigma-70 family RNA polymerase sigma factor [Qipengyuania qiaonensis]MBX7484128.1 sigma-70 family RNA polymerase sigma factor [Qipengyuania qiaonensis]